MHFLILGASGRTGKLAVTEALDRGHTVTAVVRKASSLDGRDGLTIAQGTPESQSDIEKAIALHKVDVALYLLAALRETDSPFAKPISPEHFLRDCSRNLTAAMGQTGRIIIMSVFGVGSSITQSSWVMKLIFWYTNMKFQMRDHENVDQEIRIHDGLEWTLVRPPMLKEGGAMPVKEHGETGKGLWLFSSITRPTVAKFMVDEAEQGKHQRKAIVIAN